MAATTTTKCDGEALACERSEEPDQSREQEQELEQKGRRRILGMFRSRSQVHFDHSNRGERQRRESRGLRRGRTLGRGPLNGADKAILALPNDSSVASNARARKGPRLLGRISSASRLESFTSWGKRSDAGAKNEELKANVAMTFIELEQNKRNTSVPLQRCEDVSMTSENKRNASMTIPKTKPVRGDLAKESLVSWVEENLPGLSTTNKAIALPRAKSAKKRGNSDLVKMMERSILRVDSSSSSDDDSDSSGDDSSLESDEHRGNDEELESASARRARLANRLRSSSPVPLPKGTGPRPRPVFARSTSVPNLGLRPEKSILKKEHEVASAERPVGRGLVRQVSFTKLQIREYERTLGDNPCTLYRCNVWPRLFIPDAAPNLCMLFFPATGVSSGPPISLGWSHNLDEVEVNVDEFESERPPRRPRHEFAFTASEREAVLDEWGFSGSEVEQAAFQSYRIMQKRMDTAFQGQLSARMEEVLENTRRGIHRVVASKKKERKPQKEATKCPSC
eukprot:CAMPEP_0116842096 /NCGR_PEP_ID=MMETSP0418-20121206/11316_1 /TAXON_ID=1158023 /ORGANISM="Astrosyne radiata, Strain 13vi08-1A" /LENGTH=510 /DNA_ID=CAMNT_0004472647 /DNA_START=21 /DNA_END=1553 /DNA_ORIENTATION=+